MTRAVLTWDIVQSTIGDSAQPWASVSPMFTNLAATWTGLQVAHVTLDTWYLLSIAYT